MIFSIAVLQLYPCKWFLRESWEKIRKRKLLFLLVSYSHCSLVFLLGRSNSYVMNTSINGSYTEKELQSEKGPFQLELMDDTYQYYDPGTNGNGEGSYEVLDDGVIHFTSGDFEDSIAVSKKSFCMILH